MCLFVRAGRVCLSVPIFVFTRNLSKYQWIFTKLGVCIDILEIRFGIANGQISPFFDTVICPPHDSGGVLLFHVFILPVVMKKFNDRKVMKK